MAQEEKNNLLTQVRGTIRQYLPDIEGASDPVDNIAQLIDEVKGYDDDIATAFKEDSSGILAFTGLFSAIVTLFIIESYKLLSPDSGHPGSAILWVNALWFISLVLTIVSALNIMLVQDWIRQYHRFTKGLSSDQGRARLILFIGAQTYGISNATLLSSLPLHIAVALFLAGLIIFLFTISHVIATVVAISVGLFGLWYFVLTILPTIDDLSPCFTPVSGVWWIVWHAILWIVTQCCRLPLNTCYHSVNDTLSEYKQNLMEGFRGSLVRRVPKIRDAGIDKGHKAIAWLIPRPAMDDEIKLENLLRDIPPATAPATLYRLFVSTRYPSNITLRSRFSHLLNGCTVTPGTIGLDNVQRKRRLQTCLNVLNDIAKFALYNPPRPQWQQSSTDLLNAVWKDLSRIDITEPLWEESEDTAIRITARSVCALFAVHIVRADRNDEQEQLWLQHVMGQELASDIARALLDRPRFDSMNIESFILGARFHLSGDGSVPSKEEKSFAETLAYLIYTSSSQDDFQSQITRLIERLECHGIQDHTDVAGQLRTIFRVPPPVGET